jgi:hypothetical protein
LTDARRPGSRRAEKVIHLDLTRSEIEVLAATLESAVADLGSEIAHTDRLDFRNKLKEKRAVLERVVRSLAGGSLGAQEETPCPRPS